MRYIFAMLLLVGVTACVDDEASERTVLAPLVISDGAGNSLAFARVDAQWQWMTRAPGANQTLHQPIWDELEDGLNFRGRVAPSFSASTPANLTFRAWTSGFGLSASTPVNVDFDASGPGTIAFDPSVGFPATCDLRGLCDFVAMACSNDEDCTDADVYACYSAVSSGTVPAEFVTYSCVISEYFSCVYASGGSEEVFEACGRTLYGRGVTVGY